MESHSKWLVKDLISEFGEVKNAEFDNATIEQLKIIFQAVKMLSEGFNFNDMKG